MDYDCKPSNKLESELRAKRWGFCAPERGNRVITWYMSDMYASNTRLLPIAIGTIAHAHASIAMPFR